MAQAYLLSELSNKAAVQQSPLVLSLYFLSNFLRLQNTINPIFDNFRLVKPIADDKL